MAVATNVVLATAKLEDDELVAAALLDDLTGDLCTGDDGLADVDARAVATGDEQHAIEHDLRAFIAGELFDHDGLARLDSILLSTCFDDGVHGRVLRKLFYESRTLLIARRSSRLPRDRCGSSNEISGLARQTNSRVGTRDRVRRSSSFPAASVGQGPRAATT